jgi:predicted molibdopterin-dependent oxidoreductase YjgC
MRLRGLRERNAPAGGDGFAEFIDGLDGLDFQTITNAAGLPPERIDEAAELLSEAGSPRFLFGAEALTATAPDATMTALWNLARLCGGELLPLGQECNERGLLELDRMPGVNWTPPAEILQKLRDRAFKAFYATGPLKIPRRAKPEFLVVQASHWTETADAADVVLPAAVFAESDGSFVNSSGLVQRAAAVIDPPAEARPGWWILVNLARKLKHAGLDYAKAADIRKDIIGKVPAFAGAPASFRKKTGAIFVKQSQTGRPAFLTVEAPPEPPRPTKAYPLLLIQQAGLDSYRGLPLSRHDRGFRLFRDEFRFRLNPADADRFELQNGDEVTLESPAGRFPGFVRIDIRTAQGTVLAGLASFRFDDQKPTRVLPARIKRGS